MTKRRHLFTFLSLSVILVSMADAQAPSSATELSLGAQAYKQAKYEQAIGHFEKAVALDSSNVNAHLYLATTYAQQYIPGVDLPDNIDMAKRAIAEYKQVIDLGPSQADFSPSQRINATKGIGYLYLQMKQFDDATDYYRTATDLEPNDPEAFYSIGVIDWTQTYVPRQEERAKLRLKPDASLAAKNKTVCLQVREKNWTRIADGIENLNKAVQLRPDYDDAMAYMNLMYRERADVQCDDPAARDADLRTADDWIDKTMGVKKVKAKGSEEPREEK